MFCYDSSIKKTTFTLIEKKTPNSNQKKQSLDCINSIFILAIKKLITVFEENIFNIVGVFICVRLLKYNFNGSWQDIASLGIDTWYMAVDTCNTVEYTLDIDNVAFPNQSSLKKHVEDIQASECHFELIL